MDATGDAVLTMLSGDGSMADFNYDVYKNYGTGYWKGIARVGVPILRMYDGPMGVRGNSGQETTKPNSNLSIASSFNKDIAYDVGTVYAADEIANSGARQGSPVRFAHSAQIPHPPTLRCSASVSGIAADQPSRTLRDT